MHNNPRLQHCTGFIPLPAGTLANMTPFMLPANEVRQWEIQNPIFRVEFDQLRPEVRGIYTTIGPTPTYLMGKTVLKAKSAGAAVGLDDVMGGAAAGYTVAVNMVLNQINALMHEVTQDAVQKFGRGVVCSNKVENVRQVERFLNGVVGGYAGAVLGVQVIGLGIVTILGLGPFGAFIALFLCATGAGLIGSKLFKWGGRLLVLN